jgi:hypothetical protein
MAIPELEQLQPKRLTVLVQVNQFALEVWVLVVYRGRASLFAELVST